jgi:transposase
MDTLETRFVGLDLHRHDVMIAAVNHKQDIVLQPQRVKLLRLARWAQQHLLPTDLVAVEATTNTWALHDLLKPYVNSITVAHPQKVRWIASAKVKHDKHDALVLARLLAANLLPEVWVPPHHVRQLRSLIVHRQHLTKQRRSAKNRLRGVLFRLNLTAPKGDVASPQNRHWWQSAELNYVERLRVQHDLQTLDHLEQQLNDVQTALTQASVRKPWFQDVPFLLQMPGVGLVSTMTILSAIGDIYRFPSHKKLVGYAGLGASLHASGQSSRSGGITKQGRRELRTALIQVAWAAVRYSQFWKERFNALLPYKERQKAITIIARKILVVIWHLLTKRTLDRYADPTAIERAFFKWGTTEKLASSLGLSRTQFMQQALGHVGLTPTV